jgi:sulfur carrier protein
MTILINGKSQEIADDQTIADLLDSLGYSEKKVAVARNQAFVPKSKHATTSIEPGDDIEIVAPMPGG